MKGILRKTHAKISFVEAAFEQDGVVRWGVLAIAVVVRKLNDFGKNCANIKLLVVASVVGVLSILPGGCFVVRKDAGSRETVESPKSVVTSVVPTAVIIGVIVVDFHSSSVRR